MALKMLLKKEHNHLHYDFPDAYWRIEDVNFGNLDGNTIVVFKLAAYPNRGSAQMLNQEVGSISAFGSPANTLINNILYGWVASFRADTIFTDGIPLLESEQRAILYPFVKEYLNLTDAVDVLEN